MVQSAPIRRSLALRSASPRGGQGEVRFTQCLKPPLFRGCLRIHFTGRGWFTIGFATPDEFRSTSHTSSNCKTPDTVLVMDGAVLFNASKARNHYALVYIIYIYILLCIKKSSSISPILITPYMVPTKFALWQPWWGRWQQEKTSGTLW